MSRKIEIVSAKIKDGNVTVAFKETVKDGEVFLNHESTVEPHEDLVNAFSKLDPHLASICDQWAKDGTASAKVKCRKFSLSGEDDKKGITLSGVRELYDGKVVAINTPFVFFLSDTRNYPAMNILESDLENLKRELYLYIVDNKHAPDNQMSLDFPEENNIPTESNTQPTSFNDATTAIRWSKLQGKTLYLPDGTYEEGVMEMIEEKLGNINGKNTRKNPRTFEFKEDPTQLLSAVANGGLKYISVTKEEA